MISEMILNKSMAFTLLEEIANQCSTFDSEIYLIKGHRKANAKDLVDLVTLSLHPADHLLLVIKGADSQVAGEKVIGLLN